MKLEIEVTEGDVLLMNDKQWKVTEEPGGLDAGYLWMEPVTGERDMFHRDKIEELIKYSGQVHLIREEYLDVCDF